jgi:hypothetical protein
LCSLVLLRLALPISIIVLEASVGIYPIITGLFVLFILLIPLVLFLSSVVIGNIILSYVVLNNLVQRSRKGSLQMV